MEFAPYTKNSKTVILLYFFWLFVEYYIKYNIYLL